MNYHSPILARSLIKSGTKFSQNLFTIQTIHQSKNHQKMNYHELPFFTKELPDSPILEFTNPHELQCEAPQLQVGL
jgi:hypothetical protein